MPGVEVNAARLREGLWSAQWAGWDIQLDGQKGRWTATVIAPPSDSKAVALLRKTGFETAVQAVAWATKRMPPVLVLDAPSDFGLAALLSFGPVPS